MDERARIIEISDLLARAAGPLKVLTHLAWPHQVRVDFLADGGNHLPAVSYRPVEVDSTLELVAAARALLRDGPIDAWLAETADQVETTVAMMQAAGTPNFHDHAVTLYGAPSSPLPRSTVTPLDLAEDVHEVITHLVAFEMGLTAPPSHTAEEVATTVRAGLEVVFGADAPPVTVVDELSANAAASARGIRVRRDALFTDRDAMQLLQHEAYVHVATALNGKRQPLSILAVGHPGTARAQEGLAVFAEIMSGTAELDRMRRLADRVLGIQLAVDGADFIELFRWFRERTPDEEQAFESTRRVFRGSPLTGGHPFTKDVVYLYGLLEIASTVRTAFAAGRMDLLRLLMVGKLEVRALPALAECARMGLVTHPAFLPPWVADPRGVLTMLTLSTFLTRVDLPEMVAEVRDVLDASPVVSWA